MTYPDSRQHGKAGLCGSFARASRHRKLQNQPAGLKECDVTYEASAEIDGIP